jgi:hypothetical protein
LEKEMDNLFIENVNLCCKNSNQFSEAKKFFSAQCYYITLKILEKEYYNSILCAIGLKPKKIYPVDVNKNSKLNIQELSYIFTWKSVLEKEKKSNNHVLMLDDDVRFSYNFSINLRRFLESVPKNWDILYLGASQHNWEGVNLKKLFYEAHNTKGSFAILFSPHGVQKVCESLNHDYYDKPLDEILNDMQANKYVAYPNIVISDVAQSSIRKPRKNVQIHASKMQWNLDNYDYFKYLRLKVLFVTFHKKIKQSYKNIDYYYTLNEENIKNNEIYKEKIKKYDIIIKYFSQKEPSYFYVEKEIKFVLKTET